MQSNLTASVDSLPTLAGNPKTARARRRLPAPAFVLLVGLATYVTVGAILLVPDRGDDFRRFYLSSATWAHGGNPYDVMVDKTGNLNHPLLLPLFWLYTIGSERAGFLAWSITSLLLAVACIPSISRTARLAAVDVAALILASTGSYLGFEYGQVTFVLMAIFTAAWCADRQGNALTSAALLGVLSVFKPFYGFFAFYFLWRRSWRAFTVFSAVFLGGMFAGWALVGTSGFVEWLSQLRQVEWRWHLYNASAWGVGDRLFTAQPFFAAVHWTPLAVSQTYALVVTLVILVGVAVVFLRSATKSDVDHSYALVGLAGVLSSPLGWLYYLPPLAGPIIVTLGRAPSRWLWVVGTLGVCPYLFLVGRDYGRLGTLFVGQWAFAVVGGLFLLVAMSPRRPAASEG
jgi:hypothetical protein